MRNSVVQFAILTVITIAIAGCHIHASSRYDDDDHRHHSERHYAYTHPQHVCSHDCHDHYWDGSEYVSIRRGHHHGDDCGHHWNGKVWISAGVYKNKGKAYGHDNKYKKIKKKSKGHHDQGHGNGHGH